MAIFGGVPKTKPISRSKGPRGQGNGYQGCLMFYSHLRQRESIGTKKAKEPPYK